MMFQKGNSEWSYGHHAGIMLHELSTGSPALRGMSAMLGHSEVIIEEEAVSRVHVKPGPAPENDLDLLAKVRAGDRSAFERLYRLYHPRLSRFLWTLIRRPALVEEVLDDTMMVIWNRPDSFHGASKLSTWLFAIAYRKAMRGLRKQDDAIEDLEADRRASPDAGPDDSSSRAQVRKLLMEAIAELSPAHRAVVDLTYFHELGYREIAVILECPVDTVKTRMFHARRHLRKKLGGVLTDWI